VDLSLWRPTTIWCIADETLVSDPAGVTRLNTADRDGNLLTVVEDPGSWYGGSLSGTFNYITSYTYDRAEQSDRGVARRIAPRSFIYDTLKRLTQAMNREWDHPVQLRRQRQPGHPHRRQQCHDHLLRLRRAESRDRQVVLRRAGLNASGELLLRQPAGERRNVPDDAGDGVQGRLTYVANANSSTLFGSFDAMGRVLNSTQTTNGITYPQFSYGYCGHRASAIIVPRSARSSIPRYL